MPGLLLAHVLAHLSLGGDCRRIAVRSAIAGGRSTRVTTPWALDTIIGRECQTCENAVIRVLMSLFIAIDPCIDWNITE
jgi:hypothetical protein